MQKVCAQSSVAVISILNVGTEQWEVFPMFLQGLRRHILNGSIVGIK